MLFKEKKSKLNGFTLLELLVVIAIIAVLTAMAIPYYNDYIYDSRVSVLQQNMANLRKVLNQFKGDQGRGPFLVEVQDGGTVRNTSQQSWFNSNCELFAGPLQVVNTSSPYTQRRTNLKYLPSVPQLYDPADGTQIASFNSIKSSAYFVDTDSDGIFDLDSEFAYIEGNNIAQATPTYNAAYDSVLYNFTGNDDSHYEGSESKQLDITDFTVKSSEGTVY